MRTLRGVKRVVALAVATLALGVAGCGGGDGRLSKTQYEAKMSAIGRSVSADTLDFSTTDFKNVPTEFRALARQLGRVAAQVKAIEPPRDVEDVHARIVDGFAKEAAALSSFAGRLQGASAPEVKRLLRQFDSTAFAAARQEIAAAGRALAARGYTISSSAGT